MSLSNASDNAFAALTALQSPLADHQESIESLVARIHDMVLPEQVAVGPDSDSTGQSKRTVPVADGDVPPNPGADTGMIQERLLALIAQDMATFGAQGSSEGQFGWRERDLPARFDFFAT